MKFESLFDLIIDLNSADDLIRKAAYVQLVDMGEDAVEELIDLYPKVNGGARLQVLRIFGEIGDTRAAPLLRNVVTDDHPEQYLLASSFAAKALSQIGDPRAVVPLLESNSVGARRMAALVLGNIGDQSAVPELAGALHDDDTRVSSLAARALEQIGSPGALAVLDAWRG